MPERLKGLSVRQPWAEQIISGHKTVEYRGEATKIRGRIYIYASLTLDEGDDALEAADELDLPLDQLPRGFVIGTVELTDSTFNEDLGCHEWHLSHPQRLPELLAPWEQPQPKWFHPFGRAEDLPLPGANGPPSASDQDTTAGPTTTRFAPVIACSKEPPFTAYHAKYLAYELTKRVGADKAEKLAQSLSNATVDLNPHQIDAALFAFRSPLSRGAILADEVGLGKTIEAGLIVSQLWAEKKRRILCLVPASLRKQWNRELADKFFIPSVILESKSYREYLKRGIRPLDQPGQVVICSYQFARSKVEELMGVPWDLVVIDEAHRLRNVYKKSNKIARALRDAIGNRPKVLLTATPLQNSLMELYGLVSFIDEHVFGSEEAFRELYAKSGSNLSAGALANLRGRLQPICQRTLRKQVTEYVRYTKRIPITQDFTPTADEQKLYDKVSAYLQKPNLHALPASQRQLIELVFRKILASSSYAIAGTLDVTIDRLRRLEQSADAASQQPLLEALSEDYEQADETAEEWEESDSSGDSAPTESDPSSPPPLTPAQLLEAVRAEAQELAEYKQLAESIQKDAKGEALLVALQRGFEKAREIGSRPKALIFTESRRTQLYLRQQLESHGYSGQIVLFNGTNTDPESKRVYREWLERHRGQECVTGSPTADMRSALVEEFAERASIMIATESAAEGINLQFCSLVVNYDLPWNPQRIEQRIGRCHRYGQEHDVVVINFLNRGNEADQRVFELLNEKFKLFDGVFGASDEVLGALESGIDIERRINEIHQQCRTSAEIAAAFDRLQRELDETIQSTLKDAQLKLFENFDADVHQKLRLRKQETRQRLDRYGDWLWALTATELTGDARFDADAHQFTLQNFPAGVSASVAPPGSYRMQPVQEKDRDTAAPEEFHYRPGHPLAECLIERAKARTLAPCELTLDYSRRAARVALVEQLQGKCGWLRAEQLTLTALETEDTILLAGITDDGIRLDRETCEKLLTIPAQQGESVEVADETRTSLETAIAAQQQRVIVDSQSRNETYFDAESDKLDQWAEDLKENLERELKNLEAEIRDAKKLTRLAVDLQGKIAAQKQVKDLEHKRNEKRRDLYAAQDEIERKKDSLIADVEARLQQSTTREELFTIRWRVV